MVYRTSRLCQKCQNETQTTIVDYTDDENLASWVLEARLTMLLKEMGQDEVVQFVISYPLRNENKYFIIFRYI